jgi:hypothetical protein
MNVGTGWHCEEIEGALSITGRHAPLDSLVTYLAKHSYYQISALPDPALISIDDPHSLSPSQIKLKHRSSALTIAVLMRRIIRCMAV